MFMNHTKVMHDGRLWCWYMMLFHVTALALSELTRWRHAMHVYTQVLQDTVCSYR